ncbi:PIN-like domain-containing protein [Aureibaculum luteum]|uniref:PIN-like domain-containing protein n=1 Tax=Aureibaculum luteum TaxID=1548456 RepID=UPI000E477456|nr:PIN-like domain-containing protein [Aureibaculum luteum]
MDKKIIESYRMSEEKENILWKDSIFIFDSSALLDFYFLPKPTRKKIYNEIFIKLEDRLWIPFNVQYEYLKNRESTIIKPISENYTPLKNDLANIEKAIKTQIFNRIEAISNATKKDNKHPHLEQTEIEKFKELTNKFLDHAKNFEVAILLNIKKAENEILDIKINDDVFDSLDNYFNVGREFSFNEILEITKEGKHRYEFKIPPGYGDYYKKEKKGTQIFGDLIIWKQILEYSKEKKKNVIFITNDITKDNDWCYVDKKSTDRILKPREELIKEIKDYSGIELWMYSLSQFLFNANKYLKSSIQENTLNYFSSFVKTRNFKEKTRDFIIPEYHHCEVCDNERSNVEFNSTEYSIINEYPETHINSKYISVITGNCNWCNTLYIVCPKCSGTTSLTEYNYDEKVECEGGCGIVFSVDTSKDYERIGDYEIILKDHRIEKCASCGKDFNKTNSFSDCCENCEYKYNNG